MWLVAGLGNPGRSYEKNRHNVGFIVLDALVDFYAFPDFQTKGKKLFTQGTIEGETVIAVKPMQYMNLSGPPIAEVARFYKIPLDRVVVIYDELDLALSKIRLKQGGGSAGHRGIQSIEAHLGKNFWRLKVGIDHPGNREQVSAYVLSNFISREKQRIEALKEMIARYFPLVLTQQGDLFVTKVMQEIQALFPKGG